MKRLFSLLLTAAMLCSMLMAFGISTMADVIDEYKEYAIEWYSIAEQIENGGNYVRVKMKNQSAFVLHTIEIDRPCTIEFVGEDPNKDYGLTNANGFRRAFEINSDNVTLKFPKTFSISCMSDSERDEDGGAIYVNGDNCRIEGGYFYECSAECGGAIYVNGSDAVISGSTFYYNYAIEDGGAIYVDKAGARIEDCNFKNNGCDEDGGAIYLNDDTVVEWCNFTDNKAGKDGGSIYDSNKVGEVYIRNCYFNGGRRGDDGYEGKWVYGNGDAIIENCIPGTIDIDYYDCEIISFSDSYSPVSRNKVFTHTVKNAEELKQVLEKNEGDGLERHIVLASSRIEVPGSINVESGCMYFFELGDDIEECTLVSTNDMAPLIRIYKTKSVMLNFAENIKITSRNEESGGAIYIGDDAAGCVIDGGYFENCYAGFDGGAIYLGGVNSVVKNAMFAHNSASGDGGAIYINDDAAVEDCKFQYNSAGDDGGSIYDANSVGDVYIRRCVFRGGSCHGDGIWIDCNNDAHLDGCTKDDGGRYYKPASCTNIDYNQDDDFDEERAPYSRPTMTYYASNAMKNNKNCDVIRPDINNITESENKLFTIEGKNAYGALWQVDWQNVLTIKAKDGYTITRIEAVVQDKTNYDALSIDNGTKADRAKDNPNYYGDPIKRDYIASFEDINAKSVTFTAKGSIHNWGTVPFEDFIIYYTKDSTLGSIFSGGTLWLIIGVAAAAVAAVFVIVIVVKKKKKPATANSAEVEKSEE